MKSPSKENPRPLDSYELRQWEALEAGFTSPQIVLDTFHRYENKHGEGTWIDAGYDDPIEDGELTETVTSYFCRLSAPGYMDATDWDGPYDSEIDAQRALLEAYGDILDDGPEEDSEPETGEGQWRDN